MAGMTVRVEAGVEAAVKTVLGGVLDGLEAAGIAD